MWYELRVLKYEMRVLKYEMDGYVNVNENVKL